MRGQKPKLFASYAVSKYNAFMNLKKPFFVLFLLSAQALLSFAQIEPFSDDMVAEADSKTPIEENQTAIILRTDRRKASVYLNGTYKGLTPLAVTNLAPGSYFLRIEKNGFAPVENYITVETGISSSFYFVLEYLHN